MIGEEFRYATPSPEEKEKESRNSSPIVVWSPDSYSIKPEKLYKSKKKKKQERIGMWRRGRWHENPRDLSGSDYHAIYSLLKPDHTISATSSACVRTAVYTSFTWVCITPAKTTRWSSPGSALACSPPPSRRRHGENRLPEPGAPHWSCSSRRRRCSRPPTGRSTAWGRSPFASHQASCWKQCDLA